MASHLKLGTEGEDMAAAWLIERGYDILYRNWRHSYYEIDLICLRNNVLHIVEVKCRRASPYGLPEDSVTRKKFKRLQKATDEFLFLHPGYKWVQYDVLAIIVHRKKDAEFFLLEDVFL